MMLVVVTQYCENYGEPDNPHWKYKSGSFHKIRNVPQDADYESIVKLANIAYDNKMSKEYILSWEIKDDDYLSPFERSQMDYDGRIIFTEPEQNYEDLKKHDNDEKTSIN